MSLIQAKTQRGFTLIEVLMAMVVFAMLALATATVLRQTIQSDEISRDSQQRLKSLQRTMSIIERDLGQMVARGSRNSYGEVSNKLFEYGDNYADSDAQGIRFHRLGWLNPQGRLPRGSLQQVIYRVRDQQLERLYTLYPDPVEGEEPLEQALMDGVLGLTFAFYIDGSWVTQTNAETMPRAVAVELELEGLGAITRHILLADGITVQQQSDDEASTDGNNDSDDDESDDDESDDDGDNQ